MMERIILDNVKKKFKREVSSGSFLYKLFSGNSKGNNKDFLVLNNISLKIKEGELVGIIGNNGSGKSSLLRVIAGIYETEDGEIMRNGNIISLINLGFGLQLNLSMKDNIYLGCALFGLKRKETKKRFNDIVNFSELNGFVNTRLYQFSNGMLQRLAFAIAIHCNPEILLLDEVFDVGDNEFKKKSSDKIHKLIGDKCTVILVSHDLELIEKQCDRVIWLDQGRIKMQGNPKEVIRKYISEY